MLKEIGRKIYTTFIQLWNSIAIIPSVLTLLGLGLGIFFISVEDESLKSFLFETNLVVINDIATLRTILSAFLTGLISIIIFSFSMLMLVLTRTAAAYSPRILNWLISGKNYQFILGTYLGTIIFNLILLLHIPEDAKFKASYHLAILIDALLVFICISLFVRIINSVANDIQISNIIEYIFKKTKKRMDKEEQENRTISAEKVADITKAYKSETSGYLQKIEVQELLNMAAKNGFILRTEVKVGYYYYKEDILFYLEKEIQDKALIKKINLAFVFYPGEKIQDNSFYGFRQLSEIAVKALSPGINEPRTAYICIDYLTELLSVKMGIKQYRSLTDKKGTSRIYFSHFSFRDLIDISLIPILSYGKQDVHIHENLYILLVKLGKRDRDKNHQQELNSFLKALLTETKEQRFNLYFSNYLEKFQLEIRTVENGYYYV